jgi:uncharacterized integral membrane protein
MKPKLKMVVLTWGLMLPYMGFVWYCVFTHHQRPFLFPSWFLYVAPCYFFGSIALLVVLRKKIVGDTPPQDGIEGDRRNLKWLWIGAGLYSLIFLNGLRLGLANAGELPLAVVIGGEILNGAILTAFILTLQKVHKRVQQADRLASDR